MIIVCGNMRYKAALELGLEEVPVCVVKLTKDQEREWLIKDNVEFGRFDTDILSADFDILELRDYGLSDAEMGLNIDIDFGKKKPFSGDTKADKLEMNELDLDVTCPHCGTKFRP